MWHFRGECQCGAYRGARRKSPQLSSVTLNKGAAVGPELGWAWTAHDRSVFQSQGSKSKSILYSICFHVYRMSYYIADAEHGSGEENINGARRKKRVSLSTGKWTSDGARPKAQCGAGRKWMQRFTAGPCVCCVLNDVIVIFIRTGHVTCVGNTQCSHFDCRRMPLRAVRITLPWTGDASITL